MTEQQGNNKEIPVALQDSFHLLALRRAIVVASASTAVMMHDRYMDVKQYVRLAREYRELEITLKSTEEEILQKMGTDMTRKEMVVVCYELMDTDGEADITALELAEALQKLHNFKAVDEVLPLAEGVIRNHAGENSNGLLTLTTLDDFLDYTSKHIKCSFQDLCRLFVAKIAFGQNGRTVLETMVAHVNNEEAKLEDFHQEVVRARLILIFQMMDHEQKGKVLFKNIVKHLFHFTSSYDCDERCSVLLMMEKENYRTQNVAEFLDFMLNFTASLSESITFHDLANSMTMSHCRRDVTDQHIKDLFIDDEKRVSALEADEAGFDDAVAFGKIQKLFKLMDTDNSGSLDHCELAMGMRKFTSCHDDLGKSIEECVATIQAVDDDGDGLLDEQEFAKLVAKFANSAEVELHYLIDFMVVQCSMQKNSKKEEEYLQAYRNKKVPDKRRRSSIFETMQNMWLS